MKDFAMNKQIRKIARKITNFRGEDWFESIV